MENTEENQEWPKTFGGTMVLFLNGWTHLAAYSIIPFTQGYFSTSTICKMIFGTQQSKMKLQPKNTQLMYLEELQQQWTYHANQFQQQINEISMHYPPEVVGLIRKQLLESLEQALHTLDTSLFEKYHTNEKQIKKTLQHYKQDTHVSMMMLHFETLASTLFTSYDLDVSKFTLQDAIKIVYQVLDASITVMEETYYEETGGKVLPIGQLDERFFSDLNSKFLVKYTSTRNEIQNSHGITDAFLAALITKYQVCICILVYFYFYNFIYFYFYRMIHHFLL